MSFLADWILDHPDQAWTAVQLDPHYSFVKENTSTVEEVADFVIQMGWETLQEADTALLVLNKYNPYQFISDIGIHRDDLENTFWPSIHVTIFQATNAAKDTKVTLAEYPPKNSSGLRLVNSDFTYGLFTEAQLRYVASKTPSSGLVWQEERMDCDGFAWAMKGWLAINGLENTAVAPVYFKAYKDDTFLGAHAMLMALDTNFKVWLIEPQNGKMYNIQDMRAVPFKGATRIIITDLQF